MNDGFNYAVEDRSNGCCGTLLLRDLKPGQIAKVVEWQYSTSEDFPYVVCGQFESDGETWVVMALGQRRMWDAEMRDGGEAEAKVRLLRCGEEVVLKGK